MKKLSCHQGVALITVMLVVALASILAVQMTAKLQLHLQRSINVESNQQAYWYAMGAEAFTKRILTLSFDGEETVTHLGQLWAQGENSYPVDYGDITGEISDLQSCFNLNALRTEGGSALVSSAASTTTPSLSTDTTSPTESTESKTTTSGSSNGNIAAAAFERLILAIGIENVSSFEAKDMVDALTDWLDDNDIITNNGGAEDNDYSSLEYPYLAANNYLGSINELRTVAHYTRDIIEELKPYVCVIPNSNLHQINVNTIDPDHSAILSALLDITDDVANDIISGRGEEGYQTIDDVFALPQLSAVQIEDEMKNQLVVDSEYFKLKTKTTFNDSYFFLNSIMKVEQNNQINIISRTIGRD
ncbi:type II secretion system minor pseudopilin GspK [Pseudocolwellia sp. AS88]|jgi:general secretion pathway protein K|uniref:type II secretion system minor pseudopilin GspK n=1 Tax=Pseudocolwellia sp. AS88 TaxID=3063958 RepID=UPI0026F0A46C|nr:type II secretion system minor pseudopilin GspK [Pseudocolwellia sp. AS88]MDO7083602.1 type II secretion system minor pseudopilin GspK [Pseudocolwellia sp. AS88]